MRYLFASLVALFAAPAAAQTTYPPVVVVPSSVQQTIDAAVAKADAAAAAAAAACQPMAVVPPTEVPGGTTGSGTNCRLVNAADNRISRTGIFTVSAGGAILCGGSTTCAWLDSAGNPAPLPAGAASYPMFFTAIGATGAPGVKCKVTSTTNTGFTGATCVQSVASISILGAAVEVAAATGTQVFALSLPATQANR